MYSQLFKRPPMTQKLLTKPPFKFLFDVFNSTISITGFGQGLYTEPELDPSIYKVTHFTSFLKHINIPINDFLSKRKPNKRIWPKSLN
jgi:hypothetical protein